MFESDVAREKAQGFRGPFTRLAGPIGDASEARLVIREMCFGLLLLAALQVLYGYSRSPFVALFGGLVIAVPSALLLVTLHRVAAVGVVLVGVLLFVIEILLRAFVATIPITPAVLFFIIYFGLAARASHAAFVRVRFLRGTPQVVAPPVGT